MIEYATVRLGVVFLFNPPYLARWMSSVSRKCHHSFIKLKTTLLGWSRTRSVLKWAQRRRKQALITRRYQLFKLVDDANALVTEMFHLMRIFVNPTDTRMQLKILMAHVLDIYANLPEKRKYSRILNCLELNL